ncbi:MAG TPA: chaperone modulator CbpM [Hyphomicrobiaceae bacterium]|jgi:chaperone modulatory protein CbpM
MTEKTPSSVTSEIIDRANMCTLDDLCLSCKVDPDWVAALVEYGVIEPVGQARSVWQFATLSIVRVAKAKRLERDFGLNLPGVALALDLLDQLDEMHAIKR